MQSRYSHLALEKFARALLLKAGLEAAMSRDVAEVLVEGDLLGKTTHGLALLPSYLQNLENGKMTPRGLPRVIQLTSTTLALDAHYRAGPFVVRRAIAWAVARAKKHGVATVTIRRCHHIACLQAYLKAVTDQGLVLLLMCSDPANAVIAPFGGIEGVFSPNPIGAGFPTNATPILIDTTTSSLSNAQIARLHQAKQKFPFAALQTSTGRLTNDPAVMYQNPRGTILPLGGHELGHKGFALSIMVEALANALGGHGRAEKPSRWGASVFLQVIDPKFFGGTKAFKRETRFFAQKCRKSKKRPGAAAIRLPGEKSLADRKAQIAKGVTLHPAIMPALQSWAEKLGINLPLPVKLHRP